MVFLRRDALDEESISPIPISSIVGDVLEFTIEAIRSSVGKKGEIFVISTPILYELDETTALEK